MSRYRTRAGASLARTIHDAQHGPHDARTLHDERTRAGASPAPTLHDAQHGPHDAWTRAGASPAPTIHDAQHGPYRVRAGLVPALAAYAVALMCMLLFSSCSFPGTQQQAQQPDPRLKLFHVLSERIIMLDTQAEVDGTLQNTGHDRYPYDVTLMATFYNSAGIVVGQAQGVAEDVFPGTISPFVLMGQVDSSQYSRMVVTPISLRERRIEKNLPTPPPVVP